MEGVLVEEPWESTLLILVVFGVLGINAVLLHATSRKANGRLVRPLLRIVTGRPRARSLSSVAEERLQRQVSVAGDAMKIFCRSSNSGSGSGGSSAVWEAAERWVRWDPNPRTREVVQGWIESGDEDSATRGLVGKRLAFGTSGLRGAMGPGFCRINDLVIIQTSQGLCHYLEKEGGEEFKKRGVVIGRDHRQQDGLSSEGFAHLAAAVFVSRGFRVLLMGGTVATPLVAFGVSHTKACAGVMVTASHNPKLDNGYKVYWGNGSQIIPPHDRGIAASIRGSLEPWQVYDPASAIAGPLCSDPTEQIAAAYYDGIRGGLCRRPQANARTDLEVVYSAMHGVGDAWARGAFRSFSLPPFLSVGCQRDPDPEFPTVAFPNPEEQGALKEAMLLAEERGVSLVLANDPDGDRLAAAERQPSGDWHVFSGNDIGTLLGVWQWEEWRRKHPDEDASNAVMIASTVSSNMLSAVARYEGFTFEETLPGFKWMGHRGQQLKAQGKTILFAYEEAIGFGPGDVVFEKDGLSSAALFAEMRVALHDRDQDRARTASHAAVAVAGVEVEVEAEVEGSRPPSSTTTPSSSSLSLSKWTNGVAAVKAAAAATAPSSMFLAPRSGGGGGGGAGKDKAGDASPDSPPSSPSTVGASPPTSPSTAASPAREDPAAVFSSPAPAEATAEVEAAAAAAGVARGEERRGRSSVLLRRLKALHERYGEFAEENGYVRCEDTEVVSEIFARLRGDGSYRSSFGRYRVTAVRDLAEGHGYDSETADKRPSLPVGAGGTHFLTFKLGEDGVVATLRTSGTEPKIKFYLEMQGEPGVPLEDVSARLSEVAEVFLEEALQLKRRGMKRVALA